MFLNVRFVVSDFHPLLMFLSINTAYYIMVVLNC